jgi:hypothetical protein
MATVKYQVMTVIIPFPTRIVEKGIISRRVISQKKFQSSMYT